MRLIAVRRAVQLLVVAGLCQLPWLNLAGWRGVNGSFFALDFLGIPFADPVGAAQVAAMGFLPAGRLLAGAVLSLCIALLLGRVFCSWGCPYGFLSELVYALRWRRSGTRMVVRQAFWGKILLLVLGLVAALGAGFPVLGVVSLPGELSLLPVFAWQGDDAWLLLGAAAVPLAALALEFATGRRLWCRLVCPQSVLLGLAAKCLPAAVPGLRIGWQATKCTCKGKAPCQLACSLDLNPRRNGGPDRQDCTHCGDCINACAGYGKALEWAAKNATGKKRIFFVDSL